MTTLFVPGRLCLFGEHSDWAGAWRATYPALAPGACLVAGTDQGLTGDASPCDGVLELEAALADGSRRSERIAWRAEALDALARGGGFFSYAAGVAAEALARRPTLRGLRVRVARSDLPMGKGLSSSAAVCVVVGRALQNVHGVALDVDEEMDLAWAGERRAGSACGRMDLACAYGRRTTLLGFDGARFTVAPVAVGGPLHLLVVDLCAGKDTRRILADLNACFPDAPGRAAARVRAALGAANLATVAAARVALEAGDAPTLGALMREAQVRFDADVAPASAALAAPRLQAVLRHPAVAGLAYGGKGVGSQGDGCAQLVCVGPDERDALAARLACDLAVRTLPLTLGAT